jgi:hypothetical protein
MPNQLPRMVEERILSFSIAHPGLGPKRVASELAREKGAGSSSPQTACGRSSAAHGLNTRAKRFGLIAGYPAPSEPPHDPGPEQHIDVDRVDHGRLTHSRIPADIVYGARKMEPGEPHPSTHPGVRPG